MTCAMCGGSTKVKDTSKFNDEIVRKRKCLNCNYVFFTSESEMDNVIGRELLNHRFKRAIMKGE